MNATDLSMIMTNRGGESEASNSQIVTRLGAKPFNHSNTMTRNASQSDSSKEKNVTAIKSDNFRDSNSTKQQENQKIRA
jgi:hypothetical protein